MAEPRRVVDVVGAEKARDLLRDVVRLVGERPRRQVERDALGAARADARRDPRIRLVPGDAAKAAVAVLAHHRKRDAPELAQVTGMYFDGLKQKPSKFREPAALADLERRLDAMLVGPGQRAAR